MIFPQGFLESLKDHPGFDEKTFTNTHQNPENMVSIRLNPFKKLGNDWAKNQAVPWCNQAYYLPKRPVFTLDPRFHAGGYYVQEASSMFLAHVFTQLQSQQSTAWKVLDLCAAPGGKSTLLSSLLNKEDLLLANEIIKSRTPILCDNLNKWGEANVCVSQNDPKDFSRLGEFFDVILVDAPCSGSGMFRKDPTSTREWTPENVALCAARQERILHDIYPALKKEGYLIYATCSYSMAENEAILDKISSHYAVESLQFSLQKDWKIVESRSPKNQAYGYRFYPDKLMGEGFFIACFKKVEQSDTSPQKHKIDLKKHLASPKEYQPFVPYIHTPQNFEYLQTPDGICAVWKGQLQTILQLQQHLYLKKSGVKLGKCVGKNIIPEHEMALSTILSASIPTVELNLEMALQYLRKNDILLHQCPLGWLLLTYQKLPLGWVKNLGNRINNYYPKALRILMREGQ